MRTTWDWEVRQSPDEKEIVEYKNREVVEIKAE